MSFNSIEETIEELRSDTVAKPLLIKLCEYKTFAYEQDGTNFDNVPMFCVSK